MKYYGQVVGYRLNEVYRIIYVKVGRLGNVFFRVIVEGVQIGVEKDVIVSFWQRKRVEFLGNCRRNFEVVMVRDEVDKKGQMFQRLFQKSLCFIYIVVRDIMKSLVLGYDYSFIFRIMNQIVMWLRERKVIDIDIIDSQELILVIQGKYGVYKYGYRIKYWNSVQQQSVFLVCIKIQV